MRYTGAAEVRRPARNNCKFLNLNGLAGRLITTTNAHVHGGDATRQEAATW